MLKNVIIKAPLFIIFSAFSFLYANAVLQQDDSAPATFITLPGSFTQATLARWSPTPLLVAVTAEGTLALLQPDHTWQAIESPEKVKIIHACIGGDGTIGCVDEKSNAWLRIDNVWKKIPGSNFKQMSIGNQHEVWVVQKSNAVLRKKNPVTNRPDWALVGKGIYVSCSGDGTVVLTGSDQKLYNFNRNTCKWEERAQPAQALAGNPYKVEIADAFNVVLVNYLNKVSVLLPGTTGNDQGNWIPISTDKKIIHASIGSDYTVLLIDEENNLHIRRPSSQEQEDLAIQQGPLLHSGQIFRLISGANANFRRIWTHASSPYDPHNNAPPPNNLLELLVGSGQPQDHREDIGCFFSVTDANDKSSNEPLQFGQTVEIWSLYAVTGAEQKSGALSLEWKWWVHDHHFKWGKNFKDIVVSLPTHPNATDGSQLFKLMSPYGKEGKIHAYDAVELVSLAPHAKNKKVWVHDWSRFGGNFQELLVLATDVNDTANTFYGSRDVSGTNIFNFHPVNNIKDLPFTGKSLYTSMTPQSVFQQIQSMFWKDVTAQEKQKERIKLRADAKDGFGVIKEIINQTHYPLTIGKEEYLLKPQESQRNLNRFLFVPLTLSGHANDAPLQGFGTEKVIALEPMWSNGYAWITQALKTPGSATISFIANASDQGNIQVVLGSELAPQEDIRIIIGGWQNTQSAIIQNNKLLAEAKKINNPFASAMPGLFVPYWISMHDNFIMVGSGIPGTNIFMSARLKGIEPPDRLGFSTHAGLVYYTEVSIAKELITYPPNELYPAQQKDLTLAAEEKAQTSMLDYSLRVPNEGTISFVAQASSNLSLEFTNAKGVGYRIILGAKNNTECQIEKDGYIVLASKWRQYPEITLSEKEPKQFWVSIDGGKFLIGQGEIGSNLFLSWEDPDPMPGITNIGFSHAEKEQYITNIQFTTPVTLGTNNSVNPYEKPIERTDHKGDVVIIRPIKYDLIQDGQRVTLKDMIGGQAFHVIKTPQQKAEYFLRLTIGTTGIPDVIQLGGPKESPEKVNLERRAQMLDSKSQQIRGIADGLYKAAYTVGQATKNVVVFFIDVIGAGVATALAGAGAGVWAGAAKVTAEASKTRLKAKMGYRAHDSYVFTEQATRKAGGEQSIPEEAKQNKNNIAKLLAEAYTVQSGQLLAVDEEEALLNDEAAEDGQDAALIKQDKLITIYKTLLNYINHPYVVSDKPTKEKVINGLNQLLEAQDDFPELYDELLEVVTRAFSNIYLIDKNNLQEKKIIDEWYFAMISIADRLFQASMQDPEREIQLLPLQGEYLWLPGTLAELNKGSITFQARGEGDLFVCFAEKDSYVRKNDNAIYECILGAYNNTTHEFHIQNLGRAAAKIVQQPPDKKGIMLHPIKFRTFWLSLDNGTIRLGTGDIVGENELLSWQDQFPWQRIQCIGLSTWENPIYLRAIKTSNKSLADGE